MSYTVLARRYRSTDFDGLVGQEPVARTLKNAITNGRVAHAYLFTGTRGVGKTSMARILARALNAPNTIRDCPRLPDEHDYPPTQLQERMADAIMRGDDLNVIEIDGASNRSVEEARQLIANAGLAPTGNARFKIYIIDEVHMLTREAFNALLKTMEEPPSHVKFILCTTEAHKIPATIQSRCQRFDFRNIPTAMAAGHITRVLAQEGIQADKQVIWQVARLGNGSMRDALSLLDRLIAAAGGSGEQGRQPGSGGCVTVQLLEQTLGLPNQDRITALVDAIGAGDVASALQHTAGLLDSGITQDQLIDVLIEHLRQLMLVAVCGPDSELVQLADDARQTAVAQSQQFDAAAYVYMIAVCENLQRTSKTSAHPRALLDVVVVRLALAEKMADLTTWLSSLESPSAAAVGGRGNLAMASDDMARTAVKKKGSSTGSHTACEDLSASLTQTWQRLLVAVSQCPAMSWVHNLTLVRMDGDTAFFTTRPGHRQLLGFVNDQRRGQLAELLGSIVGKPISVEVCATSDAVEKDVLRSTSEMGCPSSGSAQGKQRAVGTSDRQQALDLPLVQQVLQVFDATLVGVRSKGQDP